MRTSFWALLRLCWIAFLMSGCAQRCQPRAKLAYKIVVIGDSAAWGQGLPLHEKSWKLVEEAIATRLDRPTHTWVYARSGSVMEAPGASSPLCTSAPNEVPCSRPSLNEQASRAASSWPGSSADLIIVQGCINDVGLDEILYEYPVNPGLIASVVDSCFVEMKALLERLRQDAPGAEILVLGYPLLYSDSSGALSCSVQGVGTEASLTLSLARATAFVSGGVASVDGPVEGTLHQRSQLFKSLSDGNLEQAVAVVNAAHSGAGPGPVHFVPVTWSADHSAFADDPWLYGLDCGACDTVAAGIPFPGGMNVGLCPQDPPDISEPRRQACDGLFPFALWRRGCD